MLSAIGSSFRSAAVGVSSGGLSLGAAVFPCGAGLYRSARLAIYPRRFGASRRRALLILIAWPDRSAREGTHRGNTAEWHVGACQLLPRDLRMCGLLNLS